MGAVGDLRKLACALAAIACLLVAAMDAVPASAESVTFTATQTIPVPPASHFAGSGGGDGWGVALSETAVYNVFHHDTVLQVACHLQANAEKCFEPETIKDESGNNFWTSGEPGLYLDQHTGKLYVFAARSNDGTGGVVCIDTTLAPTNPDPFCGFTALTGTGEAELSGFSALSGPMLVGSHWYAFNYFWNTNHSGAENALLCFDVSTDAACSGQPFTVDFGTGAVAEMLPSPAPAAIGGKLIIPISIEGKDRLACFDDSTQSTCSGSWPAAIETLTYAGENGAPYPLLEPSGETVGFCIPTGVDQCFKLNGEETATPSGMTSAISATSPWNGPALVLGPRVYVPNGNLNTFAGGVQCFDYSTGATCSNFPKLFNELQYLYTVNPDPQRPTCIWVNANGGESQIQNFDAYTGESCGQGTIRALASQFVVPTKECTPTSFVSLQIIKPSRGSYGTGSIAFDNGDGNPIPGLAERQVDSTGTISLGGLELNTSTGLPQFLITLTGTSGEVGAVEVKLTWTGEYNANCVGAKTTVTKPAPPAPPPPAAAAVLPFGTAHLAHNAGGKAGSNGRACIATSSYRAAVYGTEIASVAYYLDGRHLRTLTTAVHGVYALHVAVKAGHRHKLVIKVTFLAASRTKPLTISKTLARCAVHHAAPRFTG